MVSRAVAALIALLAAQPAAATTIQFLATDLPDANHGMDLWRYSYQVSNSTFATGFGFSIFFDWPSFVELESPPPAVGSDWNIITLQPDVNLPDDGVYDALALVNGASLSQPFNVTFVWVGQGSPGPQPFVIYDLTFQTIEAGITVPEPSVLMLAAACAALGSPKLWTISFGKRRRRERIGA